MANKVLRSSLGGLADKDLGSDHAESWTTAIIALDPASLASWASGPGSPGLVAMLDASFFTAEWAQISTSGLWQGAGLTTDGAASGGVWVTVEIHCDTGDSSGKIYIDGTLVITESPMTTASRRLEVGAGYTGQDPCLFYVDEVWVGPTRGSGAYFHDDFSSGNLDAWSFTADDITVVDDPFPPPPSPATIVRRRITLARANQGLTVRVQQQGSSAATEIYALETIVRSLDPGGGP